VRCLRGISRTLAVATVLAGAIGCVSVGDTAIDARQGYSDDRSTIQVVTTNVGGKNVFIPSTIVLTAGSGRSLSFYNTTDQPHGMKIPGLGIEEVLQPGQEHVVELPVLEAGHIYAVVCHLHPPHRSASIVVLPAK
jgi:plastocyanin